MYSTSVTVKKSIKVNNLDLAFMAKSFYFKKIQSQWQNFDESFEKIMIKETSS